MSEHVVRPMQPGDVAAVERLTSQAFYDVDVRTHRPGLPEPQQRPEERVVPWLARMRHMLEHDAPGCWVAEDDGRLVGAVAAVRRELMWALATFAVLPGEQGRGIGRALLDAAGEHARGCLRGMISASSDPAAVRLYHRAGFTLHPWMYLHGRVPREVLPVVERLREGGPGDVDLMDSVDRQVRGAAHGVDHQVLLTTYRLVVADRSTGSGYAYVLPEGGVHLLAATNRRTATDLLWEAVAASSPDRDCTIAHVSAQNAWAVDLGLAAGMRLETSGYLALLGMKPPAPYLPSPHFL